MERRRWAAWRLQPEADPATPPAVFRRPCELHVTDHHGELSALPGPGSGTRHV